MDVLDLVNFFLFDFYLVATANRLGLWRIEAQWEAVPKQIQHLAVQLSGTYVWGIRALTAASMHRSAVKGRIAYSQGASRHATQLLDI